MATYRFSDLYEEWERANQSKNDWAGLPPLPDQYRFGLRPASMSERIVCSSCVDDEALRRFVFLQQPEEPCDFCGGTHELQAYVDELFEYVYRSLRHEYEDPSTSHLFFDDEEDSWAGVTTLDTYDVLNNEAEPLGDGSDLQDRFCTAVDHDWYVIDSEVGTSDQRFVWSWRSFKRRLQAVPRPPIDTDQADFGEFSARDVFRHFDNSAAQLQDDLVKIAEPGLTLLRGRPDRSQMFTHARDLGSPPAALVPVGRMNSEGEPVFYASEDHDTVLAEVRPGPDDFVTVGQWRSTRAIRYLDLAEALRVPSLFDASFAGTRPFVRFCNAFAQEISQPVPEAGVPADEYRPTQIWTRHLRDHMPTYGGVGVEAIRFPSSFTGEANWVVFVDSSECGEVGSGAILELVAATDRSGAPVVEP